MKSTLLSTFSALAFGLCALAPTTASARPFCHPVFHSARGFHHLPVGCRRVFVHGRCYGVGPFGGYVAVNPPVVVTTPACADPGDFEPADDDAGDDASVSTLPVGCTSVYLGGEPCWVHNGFYYRHCGYGFTRFHWYGRGHVGRFCGYHGHSMRCGHTFRGCHGGHGRR
jgi:hypothetical protein